MTGDIAEALGAIVIKNETHEYHCSFVCLINGLTTQYNRTSSHCVHQFISFSDSSLMTLSIMQLNKVTNEIIDQPFNQSSRSPINQHVTHTGRQSANQPVN